MRTSEQIRAEIEQTFGFLPPFFDPCLASPQVLENLWQQTRSAYLENPLSALLKEKLNALLSRFCTAPYCIIVHSSALRPLGMTAKQVLALLEASPSDMEDALPLGALPIPAPEEAASPLPDSRLEAVLLYCATAVFLERTNVPACQAELRRLLGPDLYPELIAYLAYIKTCHTWIEAHPEVSHDADRRATDNLGPLLAEEPALADFFNHYQERVRAQGLGRERRRAADEGLRVAQAQTAAILESITDAFISLDTHWRFTYVNDQADRIMSRGRDEVMGKNFWEVFPQLIGTMFDEQYHRAMEEQVSASFETYYPTLSAWLDVRVYPSSVGLSIFFQDVTPRKRAEVERERLLAEQQAHTEREVLINRIGASLRSSADLEVIQATAASLLGEALGADRCYFAVYDLAAGIVRISPDWHREDLPSVQGTYPFANTSDMFRELYQGSSTSVVTDAYASSLSAQTLVNMESLQIRSRVSVALADTTGLAATLTAAMSDGPRDWTADEVALVEAAATQLRIGVEAARVQQREHRIATDLQNALQPRLPEHIPGLSVGKFTRPALDEAQIGGDFYDIFPLDKELYALVLGDVSGKGLAAAQQLALIRNSLRTTLYLYRAPAQAAATLNGIVTAHDLLVGFVTAFVAVYDAATGQITYCSCGHEPGLVRRAGGRVEELETTGPPLGISENAEYSKLSVTLSSGDALLLYTDGISEAGPNRREMLGTKGLMRLFSSLPADLAAQAEAEALVSEVSNYTSGVFRDDVAVLLARRE